MAVVPVNRQELRRVLWVDPQVAKAGTHRRAVDRRDRLADVSGNSDMILPVSDGLRGLGALWSPRRRVRRSLNRHEALAYYLTE